MRVLLVHNPKSGDDEHAGEQITRLIADAGYEVAYHLSKSDWWQRLDRSVELVAIAGGDGTVGEVARATAGHAIPMAILPTGTANNIATWLGLLGRPLAELVAEWSSAVHRPFDFGVARGPWGEFRFLESVGIGLLAEMMAAIDAGEAGWVNDLSRREMRISAALDVLGGVLNDSSGIGCDLELDGQRMSGEYLLIEILNFGAAGPNLALAPDADCGDGLLDIVLVEAHERDLLEAHLTAVRAGNDDVPQLPIRHARHVAAEFVPSRLHLDDELWTADGGPDRIRAAITLQAGALEFLVPARSGRARPVSRDTGG
jgi:diacylglycerol kinase family enzyme